MHGIAHHTNQGSYLNVGGAATKMVSAYARDAVTPRGSLVHAMYDYVPPHLSASTGSLKPPWHESLVVGTGGVASFRDLLSTRVLISVTGSEVRTFAVAAVSSRLRTRGDSLAALLLLSQTKRNMTGS